MPEVLADRHQRRVAEDVELSSAQIRHIAKSELAHEPQPHRKPQERENAHHFGIVLLCFIFKVFFPDDIHARAHRYGFSKVPQGDQGVIDPVLEGPPEKAGSRDGNDRYRPVPAADRLDIIANSCNNTG